MPIAFYGSLLEESSMLAYGGSVVPSRIEADAPFRRFNLLAPGIVGAWAPCIHGEGHGYTAEMPDGFGAVTSNRVVESDARQKRPRALHHRRYPTNR